MQERDQAQEEATLQIVRHGVWLTIHTHVCIVIIRICDSSPIHQLYCLAEDPMESEVLRAAGEYIVSKLHYLEK